MINKQRLIELERDWNEVGTYDGVLQVEIFIGDEIKWLIDAAKQANSKIEKYERALAEIATECGTPYSKIATKALNRREMNGTNS